MSSFSIPSRVTPNGAHDWTAGRLAAVLPTLPGGITCGEAFDWFSERPDQPAAVILDADGHITGLVNRLQFLARYARRYYPELYCKRSVLVLANTAPYVVDESVSVAELGASLARDHPDALIECFVVTRNGRYLGVGTGEAVMRSKVALLQAREDELSQALAISNEASRTKSNFLALMSHELRTPLNAIIGFSEVLSAELFGALGQPRYREYAGDIHSAGKHLLALINDILDLTKAEAGKLSLHDQDVDLDDLIDECVRLMRDRAQSAELGMKVQVDPSTPHLRADRLRIKQILLNLISNAIKFTPEFGLITIAAWCGRDGGILISVTDTGIGMTPEQIPIALEPFRQVDSPHARNSEGTGLGLSLVKSLVELHDGKLTIESALHKGTTVLIAFPHSRSVTAVEPQSLRG